MDELNNTSVAETYYYIKELMFLPKFNFNPYEDMVFSDSTKIWIDPRTRYVRLKRQSSRFFPIDSNIRFRSEVINPLAARKILMIQVKSVEVEDTLTQVRLYNGTSEYYWDSIHSVWAVAAVDDWNDEGTINAHLSTFPFLPDRLFAVVVNLVTTDKYKTPIVKEILVLLELHIDYIEDLVFRSLVPSLDEHLRPVGNFPLPPDPSAVATINLNDFQIDTAFNIVDVKEVYDFTADPNLLYDLLSSYDTGTKIITLSSPIPANHVPFILFRYKPQIAYTTNQDYFEVAKVPSVVLQRMEIPPVSTYSLQSREGIVDKGTLDAVICKEPWRATFEFRIHCYSDKAVDEMRIISSVMKYFADHEYIHMVGTDEYYRMAVIREIRDLNTPNKADENVFWTRVQILDVKMPLVHETGKGVGRLLLIFKGPKETDEEVFASGHSSIVLHSPITPGEVPAWSETITIEE